MWFINKRKHNNKKLLDLNNIESLKSKGFLYKVRVMIYILYNSKI